VVSTRPLSWSLST